MVVKAVGRKITQFLDDLRDRRYWELKKETEDLERWTRKFIT